MNCQEINDLLDSRRSRDLTADQEERVGEHLLACESCESAWRASRMLGAYGDAPSPAPREGLLEETWRLVAESTRRARRRTGSFWLGGAVGAALAASIAIAAVLWVDSPVDVQPGGVSSGLAIALHETRDITLEVDSPRGLADARIHVGTSGGIEIAGRRGSGQRDMRWTADISAGINRLTIPILAVSSEDAQLLVEIEHGQEYRRFVVQVDVVPPDTDRFGAG